MNSKKKRPPALATRTALRSSCFPADDFEINNAIDLQRQACRAVEEMLANGAVFTIPLRADGLQAVLYAMPRGGDRDRCRAILRRVKEQPSPFWGLFVVEVAKIATAEKAVAE